MRLFLTTYQKSGTHQIMPMLNIQPDVVDRGHNSYIDVPERYGVNKDINWEGVVETAFNLITFKNNSNKAFGHVAYMPIYAKVLEMTNTKVIFNIRDPRDVIVAEYENAKTKIAKDPTVPPLWDFYDEEAGKRIFEKEDPLTDLIILAAARWPQWLGWMDHPFVKTIKYEDLRLNTRETAQDIVNWLDDFQCCGTVDDMVRGALPGAQNPTFRKGAVGEWKYYFKAHHIELAKELLDRTLKRMGYE